MFRFPCRNRIPRFGCTGVSVLKLSAALWAKQKKKSSCAAGWGRTAREAAPGIACRVPAENCGLPAEAENFSGAERQKQAGPENGCLCGASLRPAKKLKGTACWEKRKIAAVFLLTGAAVLKKICGLGRSG